MLACQQAKHGSGSVRRGSGSLDEDEGHALGGVASSRAAGTAGFAEKETSAVEVTAPIRSGVRRGGVTRGNGGGPAAGAVVVDTGNEHHDGAQLVDIDNDGDQDVVSIGWDHERVLLYELIGCASAPPTDAPSAPLAEPIAPQLLPTSDSALP